MFFLFQLINHINDFKFLCSMLLVVKSCSVCFYILISFVVYHRLPNQYMYKSTMILNSIRENE